MYVNIRVSLNEIDIQRLLNYSIKIFNFTGTLRGGRKTVRAKIWLVGLGHDALKHEIPSH